jgi:ATP-binding protein involved in chromosome partitioning
LALAESDILKALDGVTTPDGKSLAASGRLGGIVINDGKVICTISIDAQEAGAMEPVRAAAEAKIRALAGVSTALVGLTADKAPTRTAPTPPQARATSKPAALPGIKHIIAVASGKGGVGKSTTSCNLALGLAALGLKVGILDADIYGPSQPRLFGLRGKPRMVGPRMLEPMERYGVKVMSIGFLIDDDAAMIWRGPMVISAITQMLREVAWGELDALVVDLPPGTGDAQLTMAQQTPTSGAVIVSTPQDLALIDARRGIAMFQKVDVPLLGIIENMSSFCCPNCGHISPIFGHGGARAEAEKLGVPFLGEVPLDMNIRATSDDGRPVVATDPESHHAKIYKDIAAKVWASLDKAAKPAPRIVIE